MLETMVETEQEVLGLYPAHVSIYHAIEPHADYNIDEIYIADLRKILTPREIISISQLVSTADIYHCGLSQPAHMIMAYGDQATTKLIANDFGTAGEVITLIRDDVIVHQVRGLKLSLGLLAKFSAEYLGISYSELKTTPCEIDHRLISSFNRRRADTAIIADHLKIRFGLYEWLDKHVAKNDVISFVWSYIDKTVYDLIGDDRKVSVYGDIFEHLPYKQQHLHDNIIPRRMRACCLSLQKQDRINE